MQLLAGKAGRGNAAALLSLALLTCTPLAGSNEVSSLNETAALSPYGQVDVIFERTALAVLHAIPEIKRLWPGVWREGQRVLLAIPDGGSILIGSLPESFSGPGEQLVTRVPVADSLRDRLWLLPKTTLHGTVAFDFKLGDERAVAVSYLPSVTHFDGLQIATTVFLYHEFFHAFQDRSFGKADIDTDAMWRELANRSTGIPDDADGSLRAAERELLVAALGTRADEHALCRIEAYYDQVERRLPRVLRAGEEYAERIEGTATFFSYHATVQALGLPREMIAAFVLRDLESIFPEDAGRGVEGIENWHMYAVGAAKTMLASKFVPDWHNRIESGATLDTLLLEVAGC
jgi:hypothetical protein